MDDEAGVDDEDEELLDSDVDPLLSLLFVSLFGDDGALSLPDGLPFCE